MQRTFKSTPKCAPNFHRNQSGISLVEVLVTVLIIAIGGLGIASLQLAGLKYSAGSYGRTQAIFLADDIINRIKSNRKIALGFTAVEGSIGAGSAYEIADFTAAGAAPLVDCLVAPCNLENRAEYDISSWLEEIERALPSGQGRIRFTDEVSDDPESDELIRHFEIGLQWRQTASTTNTTSDPDDEIKQVFYRITI